MSHIGRGLPRARPLVGSAALDHVAFLPCRRNSAESATTRMRHPVWRQICPAVSIIPPGRLCRPRAPGGQSSDKAGCGLRNQFQTQGLPRGTAAGFLLTDAGDTVSTGPPPARDASPWPKRTSFGTSSSIRDCFRPGSRNLANSHRIRCRRARCRAPVSRSERTTAWTHRRRERTCRSRQERLSGSLVAPA